MADKFGWGKRVSKLAGRLTETETRVLEYVTESPHEAAFMSLKDLCERTGVSKPKIIQLYRKLGYERYKEFRNGVEEFYAHHINAYRASKATFKDIRSFDQLVTTSIEEEAKALQRQLEHVPTDDVEQLARSMLNKRRIYILGTSTGMYPAHYLFQRLKRYKLDVRILGEDSQHIVEDAFGINEDDMLLVFHYFPDRRRTHGAMKLAHDCGALVVVATDTMLIELTEMADQVYFVARGSIRLHSSMAVPMHFVNLVMLAIEWLGGETFQQYLLDIEKLRERYDLG
ncbi:transcriptional regulator, RpiR family [Alkalispirochaeta americana]|uniref:Transcriptional regulator, RpiR family n=1 Tax=Alkalispirochaeta americana TaxID=159291 RepID=A0A1N6VXJ8_9SPIO|nr:MurR/RpiR family transcriptional regulator [Alkalispirochaeta americana]SIQ82488.1 transcriptional regulator, RpiR family [Alkalispirochaeta americana]